MPKGLVLKSTGSWYLVQTGERLIDCRIKGKFRTKGIRTTNPVAVGDRVFWQEEESEKGIIVDIEPRENYIIRRSINLSKESHIIAANIDQAMLLVTMAAPQTSTGFIDRFLVTAEAYRIPVHLVFNKMDSYSNEQVMQVKQWSARYEKVGYPCHQISALKPETLDTIETLTSGKTTLLSGHSGVGKSTLINSLEDASLRTSPVSDTHQKGKHSTTFAEMIPLKTGGYLIDTPGIKGFGIIDIEKHELAHFFPEMRERMNHCKFNNCVHVNEPGCAIKEAVAEGEIPMERYENYLNLYLDEEDQAYR